MTHSCWQYQIWMSDELSADLSREQGVTLKAHLASCPSCSKLHEQLSREHELMKELSKDLERSLERVQERAMEEIRHAQQAPRVAPWPRLTRIAAVLLLMVSLVGIAFYVSERLADSRSRTEYSQKVTEALAQALAYYQAGNTPALNGMLSFDHEQVKLTVIDYLAEIGDASSVVALLKLAATEPSAEIQAAVQRSIASIRERLNAAKSPAIEAPETFQADTVLETPASVNEPDPGLVPVPSPNQSSEEVSQEFVKTTRLSIFDSVTQDPIDQAKVVVDVNGIMLAYYSDPNGICTVDIEGPMYTNISVSKDQYVTKEFGAQAPGGSYYRYTGGAKPNRPKKTEDIPDALTVALVPAFTIGGMVITEEGDAIEGVKLSVSFSVQDDMEADWTHAAINVVTDSNGVWESPEANANAYRARVSASHDRYVWTEGRYHLASIGLLRQKQHVIAMQKQNTISGRIVDEQGNGIKKARVYDLASGSSRFADENGQFEIPGVLEGATQIAVVADGYAPVSFYETIIDGQAMLVTLKAGHPQRLRILDPEGNPIAGARVHSVTRVGTRRIFSGWGTDKQGSDANGMIEGLGRLGQVLSLTVEAEGYTTREDVQIECSESLHQLTLTPQGQLLLSVFDAETNEPISEYSVVFGESQGEEGIVGWRHSEDVNTPYTHPFDQDTGIHCCLLVDARGYLSEQIEIVSSHETRIERSIFLHRGNDISGRLFDPNGKPKANTDVLVCFDDSPLVSMQNRKLETTYTRRFLKYRPVKTDDLGRFEVDIADKHFALMAASDEGIAMVRDQAFLATGEMHMQAWGSLEGVLHKGNQVAPYEEIQLEYLPPPGFAAFGVQCYEHTLTDHAGRFHFKYVRPGPAFVGRVLNRKQSNRTNVTVLSGETSFVNIAGGGRPVLMAYTWPREIPLPWSFTYDFIICRASDEAISYDYAIKVDRSGQIQIDDILPGTYTLSGRFAEGKEALAKLTHRFYVPEIQNESDYRTPLHVGELSLVLVPKTGRD